MAPIRDRDLVAYYALASGISLGLALLLNVSLLFGLLALFGPATAAFLVARRWGGPAGVAALRAATTRWRVHPGWYAAAVALPLTGFALGHALYVITGHPVLSIPGDIQPIMLVLFVLVIGEEVGWRGFLLRGLLERRSPLEATLTVGIAWALWHAPLYFLPGMPSYGSPFLAFVAWVVPLSFLLTWLWLGTRSAWLTTVMHGTANLGSVIAFPLAEAGVLYLYAGVGTAIVALLLVATLGHGFVSAPAVTAAGSGERSSVERSGLQSPAPGEG